MLPLGYYAGRSGAFRGLAAPIGLLGLLLVGLLLIPALSHFALWQPLEWAAGMIGAVAGFRLGKVQSGISRPIRGGS